MSCTLCPLHKTCHTVNVNPVGDLMGNVLILSEFPGADEDESGKGYLGNPGKLTAHMVEDLKLQATLSHAVRCRPEGDRKPNKDEIGACYQHLEALARSMPNLAVIVALGEVPCRTLGIKGKLTEMCGSTFPVKVAGKDLKAVVLQTAKHVIRNPGYASNWEAHWHVVRELVIPRGDPADTIGAVLEGDLNSVTGDLLGLDLETSSLEPRKGSILSVGLSSASSTVGRSVSRPDDLLALKRILEASTPLAVQDVRMEGTWSEDYFGIRLTGDRVFDTKLIANRVYPGQPANLAALVARHLPHISGYKGETDTLMKAGRMLEIPKDDLVRRVAVDAWASFQLVPILLAKLSDEEKRWLPEDVDLSLCVKRMAERGVPFDEEEALNVKREATATQERLSLKYKPINLGSSQQVAMVLTGMGCKLPKSEKQNDETGEIVLQAVSHYSTDPKVKDFCADVLAYRGAQKIRTTYVEGYAKHKNAEGRICSDLRWPGTISWRLSSSDPNLQNIPRGVFRRVFKARPGYLLVEADYAQAELRIATALAPEPTLQAIFMAGGDPHSLLARKIFGPSYTKEQRVRAKTTNFGLRYGAGPHTLWEQFAKDGVFLEPSETQSYHTLFWETYKGFSSHVERQFATLRSGAPVLAPTGGLRWSLEDTLLLKPKEHDALLSAENSVIQCVPPRWALRAALWAEGEGIKVILNTHDGLIAEVCESQAYDQARRLGEIMGLVSAEDWMQGLPCPADVKVGRDLYNMKPLEEWRP